MRTMIGNWFDAALRKVGIEPRAFRALTNKFLLMDFRGSHYAQSTGVGQREVLSPLVCVIGQCLLLSAITAGVLFRRVDVFFFAFANLAVTMIVIAAAVVVEFQEVVFDPRDREAIAPRPITPRTYSAARFTNLMFYVLAMWLSLSLFPLILGAGLLDSGGWYAPAYFTASLATAVITAGSVILILAAVGDSPKISRWRDVLAWVQVALLLIIGYGAQMMFRRADYALEMWAAYPPDWIRFLPPAWLAWFVEDAAIEPTLTTLGTGAAVWGLMLIVCIAAVIRLGALYDGVHPLGSKRRVTTVRPKTIGGVSAGLGHFVCRNRAERTGYWLFRTMLKRDPGLRMRCLYALNTVAAVVILGLGIGEFENPMAGQPINQVLLPILAVYLVALSVPVALYNATFVKDASAAWLLFATPVDPPEGIARGVCKALMVTIVIPVSILLGLVAGWAWQSPVAAVLHAGLALLLSWPTALASLWLATPAHPFTREPSRGGSIGPIAIPLAGFTAAAMLFASLHFLWAAEWWFWLVAAVVTVTGSFWLGRMANRRMRILWEQTA